LLSKLEFQFEIHVRTSARLGSIVREGAILVPRIVCGTRIYLMSMLETVKDHQTDALGIVSTFDRSDEQATILMEEREKAKASWHQPSEPLVTELIHPVKSKKSQGKRSIKDGVEKPHRNKQALSSPPIKDSYEGPCLTSQQSQKEISCHEQPTSPSGTASTVSEVSEDDKYERLAQNKARFLSQTTRRGIGFFKGLLRKNKPLPISTQSDSVLSPGSNAILRDLDVVSTNSIGARTVRRRNTKKLKGMPGDSDDPSVLLKRARKYKKKALRLLCQVTTSSNAGKECETAVTVNPDMESQARKAYRYASESKRLRDLANMKQKSKKPHRKHEISKCMSDTSVWSGISDGEDTKRSSMENKRSSSKTNVTKSTIEPTYKCADDSSVSTFRSTFSARVERDEHKRKMKELEFFGNFDLRSLACGYGSGLAQQYVEETERIVHSLGVNSDIHSENLSIMSSQTFMSSDTTATEIDLRQEHSQKMKELELFSPSLATDALNTWMLSIKNFSITCNQNISKPIEAIPEETVKVGKSENEDDDASDDETKIPALNFGPFCSPTRLKDVVQDDYVRFDDVLEYEDRSSRGTWSFAASTYDELEPEPEPEPDTEFSEDSEDDSSSDSSSDESMSDSTESDSDSDSER
jgi:hypothetical protein